jgi:hypothetical protein
MSQADFPPESTPTKEPCFYVKAASFVHGTTLSSQVQVSQPGKVPFRAELAETYVSVIFEKFMLS